VEADGPVTVALDVQLNDELVDEGFAREMVNKIQNMRKSSGLDVTDNIEIRVRTSPRLEKAAGRYGEFICRETLAKNIEFVDDGDLKETKDWDINGEKAAIQVVKV
jgi:isoleucyl-tRNA synthetase